MSANTGRFESEDCVAQPSVNGRYDAGTLLARPKSAVPSKKSVRWTEIGRWILGTYLGEGINILLPHDLEPQSLLGSLLLQGSYLG